jgi:hypothetical protein
MTDQSDLRGGIVLALVIAALAFTSTNDPDVPH